MEFDSPYAPPRSNVLSTNTEGWDGKYFRLRSPGAMPHWCLRCGGDDAHVEKSARLRWVNPFTYLWILVSPIVLMIAYAIVVKRVPVAYRQCADCAKVTARWTKVAYGALILFVLSFAATFALERGHPLTVVLAGGCLASMVVGMVAAGLRAPSMAILKHDKGVFYVGRMKKAFRARLGA